MNPKRQNANNFKNFLDIFQDKTSLKDLANNNNKIMRYFLILKN